jgi:hypothetical protein
MKSFPLEEETTEQAMGKPSGKQSGVLGPTVDLRPLESLLARIEEKLNPVQVWLFGTHARTDAAPPAAPGSATHPAADWSLFVVVPDDTQEAALDMLVPQPGSQRGTGAMGVVAMADVVLCRAGEFKDTCNTPGTAAYIVANEGVLIYAR